MSALVLRRVLSEEHEGWLCNAIESGHVAGDTAHYVRQIHPDPNGLLSSIAARHLSKQGTDGCEERTCRLGLRLEASYEGWRSRGNRDAMAAVQGLRQAAHCFEDLCTLYAHTLACHGVDRLGLQAFLLLERRCRVSSALSVLRRALQRASWDTAGWSPERFSELVACYRAAEHASWRGLDDIDAIQPEPTTARERRKTIKDRRKTIVRSSRLLSRLVGHKAVRMFVGGGVLRIEGRLAVYEMRKCSTLEDAHGGHHALGVFDRRDPDILLCMLCIRTEGVPLLDHVASLVLHIQGGMEEEILRTGNAARIQEQAYGHSWLEPLVVFVSLVTNYQPPGQRRPRLAAGHCRFSVGRGLVPVLRQGVLAHPAMLLPQPTPRYTRLV